MGRGRVVAVIFLCLGEFRCVKLYWKCTVKEPRFEIGTQVHLVQNHCAVCKKLEGELRHPVVVVAATLYDQEFEYRIVDASGAHYETRELCLCRNTSGHRSNPCDFCGQAA